jgi:hypothetical protein
MLLTGPAANWSSSPHALADFDSPVATRARILDRLKALTTCNGLACCAMRPVGSFSGLMAALTTAGGLVLFAAGAPVTATAARASQQARQQPIFGNPAGHADVPAAGRAVNTSHPTQVIGKGTPAGCTSAAVVAAVAKGGIITFACGPKPVTITLTATAKVVNTSRQVVLDGGGLVTLSGGGTHQILYMNTCDPQQKIAAAGLRALTGRYAC